MKIGKTDTDKDVYIIAEIGNNHEGSFDVAREMLVSAAACGVNAVKFQTFKSEFYVSQDNPDRFNRLKSFELTYKQFEELSSIAASEGVDFISTPFDLESAEFLSGIVAAMKISSSDNVFYPLLEKVAGYDLPLLLSGGILDLNGLKKSADFIESKRKQGASSAELCLMHCICSYPATPENANLKAIRQLKRTFDNTIGYSDHTLGTQAVAASVALGARVIEKHFTLDKNYSDFRDHQISADPQEMKQIVEEARIINQMLGEGVKKAQPPEVEIEPLVRRSIRASRSLEAGCVLTLDDIKWVRPGGGLKPGEEELILGKALNRSLKADELIRIEDTQS